MSSLELAVVGNCSYGALIDERGRVCWACLPSFDGDPVFCSLLNGLDSPWGFFDVELQDFARSEQSYVDHTAVVSTRLWDERGSGLEIVDFAPRFHHYGRYYRPPVLVRRLRPIAGSPRVRIRVRPRYDYGACEPEQTRGSNHIRYVLPRLTLRLTSDAPISFIVNEVPFLLDRPLDLHLGPDESLTRDVGETASELQDRTESYWREFSRHLSIPFEWQDAVIRAAITLKLCSFEESGAIIAAMTTSIPEAPHSGRNWDYRFCWLRDAYFVVHALNRLGVTDTLEQYLGYLTNLTVGAENGYLQPVFGIRLERELEEREVTSLSGYRGMGPVRVGNQAYEQIQNDGYGSAVLAVTQSFFDRRLMRSGSVEAFRHLEKLGAEAARRFDEPDAGPWEIRSERRVHTFSAVMCWAACDRLAKIGSRLGLEDRCEHWRREARRIRGAIEAKAWNEQLGRFTTTFGGTDVDASLLLLYEVGFLEASDPRFAATVEEVERELLDGNHVFRYRKDEFGEASTAFTVCTFWYIGALAALGRTDEARQLFEELLERRNSLGILSEDLAPATGELWGNFPQTYSMVGLINAAMRLSKTWEDAF